MKNYNINMEFLGVSRKKAEKGDIFAFKNKYLGWVYGRIIKLGGPMGESPENFLVYIYNYFTKELELEPKLDKNNLAIDPIFINRRGWLDGYFKTIGNKRLTSEDALLLHCFVDLPVIDEEYEYVDEFRRSIPRRVEPCGTYGLTNHRKIDDLISEKYNLPFAELTEKEKEIIKSRGETWPQKIKWW